MPSLKKTKPERDYFTSLEQVGKLLLKKLISFEYSYKFLKIKDSDLERETLVETVSYDIETKEVVLMSGPVSRYMEIKHSDFLRYVNSAK